MASFFHIHIRAGVTPGLFCARVVAKMRKKQKKTQKTAIVVHERQKNINYFIGDKNGGKHSKT